MNRYGRIINWIIQRIQAFTFDNKNVQIVECFMNDFVGTIYNLSVTDQSPRACGQKVQVAEFIKDCISVTNLIRPCDNCLLSCFFRKGLVTFRLDWPLDTSYLWRHGWTEPSTGFMPSGRQVSIIVTLWYNGKTNLERKLLSVWQHWQTMGNLRKKFKNSLILSQPKLTMHVLLLMLSFRR